MKAVLLLQMHCCYCSEELGHTRNGEAIFSGGGGVGFSDSNPRCPCPGISVTGGDGGDRPRTAAIVKGLPQARRQLNQSFRVRKAELLFC